jgi:putative phosphonate metabolism protein
VLAVRYAIYFSPAKDHPLTEAASRWLGRNAFSGAQHYNHATYAEMTEEPRRYGFHATLKAPFELSEKYSEADLVAALEQFAASQSVFDIPRVVIGALGPFFALIPDRTYQPLQDFAAEIVDHFDRFRAPLSETDIARRRPQNLTESQRQNLSLWGYPHVMDDFHFHMTLTGRIDESDAPAIQDVLSTKFSEFVDRPLTISGLALFVEETRGAPFTVHRWHPLGQPPKKDADP